MVVYIQNDSQFNHSYSKIIWLILRATAVFYLNKYHQASSTRGTKSKQLYIPRLVLQLSLPNPLKPSRELKCHDDVIKWKHFPRNWPFVREIHRSPVNFPHKGQWRGALMFSLIYARINDWVNNREAGDLRRQHGHYDVIVMYYWRSADRRCSNYISVIDNLIAY